ncbi:MULTISPECIES: iron chaperone [Deinococcus]|uniref:DUF1801 domain-containing protein n=1 Tax=Deinococcus rufus TaxID=2136097 RepID=A0ABV7Z616_9DEIO|nr:DUF1801 domain-containing protein [Deinococcus sp. AB2017081]WQE95487.1 DUF1801 domain-containing protein [Deinococcus sp. AB2017081]
MTRKAATPAFSAEERAAMRERAREAKAEAKHAATREEGEQAVLARLAKMTGPDRALGEALHRIITAAAPGLVPRLWYGMPAYAQDGKVVCFYQDAKKFGARYATLGFSDQAKLDDGLMWPTSYALTELSADGEQRITELVRRAVG